MVKRLTQPPRLSWLLWDTVMPELTITCYLQPHEHDEAMAAGGPNALGVKVREALRVGELKLQQFQQQLMDL